MVSSSVVFVVVNEPLLSEEWTSVVEPCVVGSDKSMFEESVKSNERSWI